MVHLTLFLEGNTESKVTITFPILKIDLTSKGLTKKNNYESATMLLLQIYSSYKFVYDPRPLLQLTVNQTVRSILRKLQWNMSHVDDIDVDLAKYLNMSTSIFSNEKWSFKACRVEIDEVRDTA
jgi:hypothetical protein